MKFEMNMKTLKDLVNKAEKAVMTKTYLTILKTVLIRTYSNSITLTATDIDTELNVFSTDVNVTEPGQVCIDASFLKKIVALKVGKITISTEEDRVIADTGKKVLTFTAENAEDFPLKQVVETTAFYKTSYADFADTLERLSYYTAGEGKNKMMAVYSFNSENEQIVALDGHRCAVKCATGKFYRNRFREINLPNSVYPKIKNCLKDQKNEEKSVIMEIADDGKKRRCIILGADFMLKTDLPDGVYFQYEKMFTEISGKQLKISKEDLLEISTYNKKLISASDKIPMIFCNVNGKAYAYTANGMEESVDILDVSENTLENGFYIGVNPQYVIDLCKTIDTNEILFSMTTGKAPIFAYGDKYTFLILPVHCRDAANAAIERIRKIQETAKKLA